MAPICARLRVLVSQRQSTVNSPRIRFPPLQRLRRWRYDGAAIAHDPRVLQFYLLGESGVVVQ